MRRGQTPQIVSRTGSVPLYDIAEKLSKMGTLGMKPWLTH